MRLCLLLLSFQLLGWPGALAAKPAAQLKSSVQSAADGEELGRVNALIILLQQRKNKGEITQQEYVRALLAAENISANLSNRHYRDQVFLQTADQTQKLITGNPAAHAKELQQAQQEVEEMAKGLAEEGQRMTKPPVLPPTEKPKSPAETSAANPKPPVVVPPPPRKPIPQAVPPHRFPYLEFLIAVLVLLAEAAAYALFRSHQKGPSLPPYTDLRVLLRGVKRAQDPATSSAPRPAHPREPGKLKEYLFAEQKATYQARYNEVAEEMTSASVDLDQLQGVVEGVRNNLKLLSQAIYARVQWLVLIENTNLGAVLQGAVLLKPISRLFGRAGTLLKLILGSLVVLFVARIAGLVWTTHFDAAVIECVLFFALLLLAEMILRLKDPVLSFRKCGEKLDELSVAFVYDEQTTQLQDGVQKFPLLRVQRGGKTPPTEEFSVSATSWGANVRRDSFLLYVGDMAVYRMERNGNGTLIFINPNDEATNSFCRLMTSSLSEQKTFAASTLDPLVEYARAVWRKRSAAAQVPWLEKLLQDVGRVESIWRDVYVSDPVFEFVQRRINMFNIRDLATPKGILFLGMPGSGRTYLAKKIADSISARFEQINAATLNSEKEVKALWERSRGKTPVVLFVESAERVFPPPGSQNQGAGTREATLSWLVEWGRMEARESLVLVIMTARNEEELHPSIMSIIVGSKIEIGAPDQTGRDLILRRACRDNHMAMALPATLVARTAGSTIHDLYEIVRETKMLCAPDAPSESQWEQAVKTVRGDGGIVRDPTRTWKNLILPQEIKDKLQRVCRGLGESELYKERKIRMPSILLTGPPGTGKTEIARTIANESLVLFVDAGISDMKGKFVGESAGLVHGKFQKARDGAPAVLFIDEFETLVGKRDSDQTDQFAKDIVTQINREMDGVSGNDRPILVIAATNFPEQIDAAILNRFQVVPVPLPDEAARGEILRVEIRRQAGKSVDPALDIDKVSTDLARKTPGKSGRNLRDLVQGAIMRSTDRTGSIASALLAEEDLYSEIAPKVHVMADDQLEKLWAGIVLKPEVKTSLLSKIRAFNRGGKSAPAGLLLYGPPGTGKSEIAKLIAKSTSSHFMELQGSSMKKGFLGQAGQAVSKIWDEARSHIPCLMFIDECDGIFKSSTDVETDVLVKEIVEEFKASWQPAVVRGQIWVVGATNHRELLDEALMSRFGDSVKIDLPEAAERREILRLEMLKAERDWEIPGFVAEQSGSCSGRDLATLVNDVCMMVGDQSGPPTEAMWKQAVGRVSTIGTDSGAVDPDATWDTLVVSDSTLKTLKVACQKLRNFETLRKQGIQMSTGILLYGPPGTGKTRIASTLANESKLAFVSATLADYKGAYVGHSAKMVKALFARARSKAPCILFMDELDGGTAKGLGSGDTFNTEIITQLKTELAGVLKKDERPLFLVAAANHPEEIDDAILSRFTERILIPNPDAAQRQRLLKIMLAKQKKDFDADEVCAELAARVGNVSGRDLENLVKRASDYSVERAALTDTFDNIVLQKQDLFDALTPAG